MNITRFSECTQKCFDIILDILVIFDMSVYFRLPENIYLYNEYIYSSVQHLNLQYTHYQQGSA